MGAPETVVVVSALSLSVLNDEPAPPGELTPDALAERIAEQRPDVPSSELTPLPMVVDAALAEIPPAARLLRLVLLHDATDPRHQRALEVIHLLVRWLDLHVGRVELVPRDMGSAAVGPDASTTMTAVPEVLADLAGGNEPVWVNATAGVSSVVQPLVALAGVAGWTVFTVPDRTRPDIAVLPLPPIGPDRVEVLRYLDQRHLRAELATAEGAPPPPEPAFAGLAGYYERLAAQMPERPAYAACATLLDLHADLFDDQESRRLAQMLRELVDHWVTQRLWSLNLVPELVAHDDRHVERVDGLVASLAAGLLHNKLISPLDVVVLSAAAWLHDWGHVGSRLGSGYISHPVAVRKLHGVLTSQLIADFPQSHRLGSLAPIVAMLCAHHQGWCSCHERSPVESSPNSVGVRLVRDAVGADDVAVWLPSLHDAAAAVGLESSHAELLVALLRVADAADVGVHRVPDYGPHRAEFLTNCGRRALSRASGELAVVGLQPVQLAEANNWLDRLASEERIVDPDRELLPAPFTHPALELVEDYLELLRTTSHFDIHHSVLQVRLATGTGGVRPMVVPRPGAEDRALEAVYGFIDAELLRPDDDRGRVGRVLAAAGIIVLEPQVVNG